MALSSIANRHIRKFLHALAVLGLLATFAVANAPAVHADTATFSTSESVAITGLGAANPYPSTIDVSGLPGQITTLTVTLNGLSHGYLPDIDVLLVGPDGSANIVLLSYVSVTGVSDVTLTFDDAAADALPYVNTPASGSYRPTAFAKHPSVPDTYPSPAPAPEDVMHSAPRGSATLASAFGGLNPNGAWSLYIVDTIPVSDGTLSGWSLTITTDATDSTPPVITPQVTGTQGSDDWYTSDVGVSWTAEDAESGVTATDGCDATTITNDTAGTTLTCLAVSAGGVASETVTIKRDATAPIVTVTGVADGAIYAPGSVPAAGCQTTDTTSGVATDATLQPNGGVPADIGVYTATCAGAIDNAGNQAAAQTVIYSVQPAFIWRGEFKPAPALNRVAAGEPLYLRFSVGGTTSLDILADGSPSWQWRSCATGHPIGEPMPARLIRDLDYVAGAYQLVVRTASSDAGRCGDLVLTFTDGAQHTLRFQFTRNR